MLGGADNPNGELPSYITGADTFRAHQIIALFPPPKNLMRRYASRLNAPGVMP